jgi:eukaryotic-like serine/threonine-protein kinase
MSKEEIPFEKIESKVGYRIIKQIGKGAFAKVFLALREGYGLDRYVAIKVVDMSLMDERHRMVILDEAKITGKLSHPNIIHIYDCGMVDSEYFFNVIELVNGYSLREIIQRHTSMVMDRLKGYEKIPVSLLKHATASILMQICLGLSYIHNARDLVTGEDLNVIHNDLKPGNILIGFDGSLKVSDFGISYSPLRSVKLKGGSPAYMAPEWIRSLLDGPKTVRPVETSDIYSLGVCLHETLTDRRLFRAKGNLSRPALLEQIYDQMKNYKPGTTRRINPAADPELCRIADRCLRFDPTKRYQDSQSIIAELDEMISDGHFHPQIMDRRFLAEYMDSLYKEDEHFRFIPSSK